MKRNKLLRSWSRLLTMLFVPCIAPNLALAGDTIELTPIGTFATGIFDDGAAEILAHDPATQRLFVVNGADATIDVLDISNPSNPVELDPILVTVTIEDEKANSVAVHGGLVAAAVENVNTQAPGAVIFFDTDGTFLKRLVVGNLPTDGPGETVSALPDMLTFSPNGQWLLVANEGEPSDDYSIDPEGSVSMVDLRNGVANATVIDVDFRAFNGASLDPSIRVFGPNATVAQDLEPEYIAFSDDSLTAWVTLQENNAMATIDIASASVSSLTGLGFKDHSSDTNTLDASNEDGLISPSPWPTNGMFQPDTVASYQVNGQTFLITANEGDARDYAGFSEEERVADLVLDPNAFPNAAVIQQEAKLGRLKVTNVNGDSDGDGDFDELFSFGARSFAIWSTGPISLAFDSGDDLERITVAQLHEDFNSTDNENNSFDDRSDDKGPEPEGVAIGDVSGTTYAFIGLERIGGIAVFDVSDPNEPSFAQYINTRDFSGDAELGTAGDLAPEGLAFISAADSPINQPLLAVAFEVSGTTTIFAVEEVIADRSGDNVVCNSTLTGTFDNVTAVAGGTCVLSNATVEGNVTANNGADLLIFGGTVEGNVRGNSGSSVVVVSSVVEGNVACNGTVGPNGCQVSGANVDGNVSSTNAGGGFVNVFSSTISGNVQMFNNAVQAFVSLNTIGDNLQCSGNSPAPNPGGLPPTNVVNDDKEGQCSAAFGF